MTMEMFLAGITGNNSPLTDYIKLLCIRTAAHKLKYQGNVKHLKKSISKSF